MSDLKCPYCDEDLEVCHDDGAGYEEGRLHEMECRQCEKVFGFQTTICFHYEPQQVACWNGEPHVWVEKPQPSWPESKRCSSCDELQEGRYEENYWPTKK